MKIGLFTLNENFHNDEKRAIDEQIKLVEFVDELGFDEVWFGEHHFNSFSVIPDPSLMIAHLSATTTNITLGTAGFLAPFYHPIRLAESIIMLDYLSDSRIALGFAKGGFAPDTKYLLNSSQEQKKLMFDCVNTIDDILHKSELNQKVTPKPRGKKLPIYIATFASKDTIEYAAQNGYGLMFSQGASIQECKEAQEYYKDISGVYPETVLLRMYYLCDSEKAIDSEFKSVIEHFISSMRAAQKELDAPIYNQEYYYKILKEREGFFNGENFFANAIYGGVDECVEKINNIKKELKNVHLALKPGSTALCRNIEMLREFQEKIKPKI